MRVAVYFPHKHRAYLSASSTFRNLQIPLRYPVA